MLKLNKFAAVLLLTAACLFLSGCGGSDDNEQVVTKSSNSEFEASHTESSSDDVLVTTSVQESEKTTPTQTSVSSQTTSDSKKTQTSKPTAATTTTTTPADTTTTSQSVTVTSPPPESSDSKPSATTTTTTVQTTGKIPTETHATPQLPVETPESLDYTKALLDGLDETELDAYNRIVAAVMKFEETVYFPHNAVNQQQVENCLLLMSLTALETNYVSTKYVVTVDENGFVTKLALEYNRSEEQYKRELDKLKKVVKEIVEGCTVTDDYQKTMYIHDRIIKGCRYDSQGENMLSAYGCLVDGKAVCEGYSKAFMLLCAELGVECIPVIGTTFSDGVTESHMWNMVKIDGVWYHFDVTWDDPITKIGDDFVKYDYFALGDSEISKDHTATEIPYFSYPKAYSSRGDYFTKNGLVANTADKALEIIEEQLVNACVVSERFVRVKVSGNEEFEKLCKLLFEPEENGKKKIFALLRDLSQKVDNADFNPGRYSKLVNEDKNILTIILNYE